MAAKKKKPTKKPAAKKPAAKKAAAKKPAKKTKKKPKGPDNETLHALAKKGDLDGIERALEPLEEYERDDTSYYWFSVADDYGHKKAAAYVEDLCELSSLRYDDDQLTTGGAHFDLGTAYLLGTDSLPRDLEKARKHFTAARERYYPWSVQGSKKMIADLAKRAGADRGLVDDAFATAPQPGERARNADPPYDDDED